MEYVAYGLLGLLALLVIAIAAFILISWTPARPVKTLVARWAPPPSKFIDLEGMQIHVRDEGPQDDPTPIVLLHGTGASLHTWEGWTAHLKAKHRVISFDRPGFGLTGPNPSGNYSSVDEVRVAFEVLKHLGVERCILVGNSSGGRLAWRMAVTAPQRVARLALLAPAGYPRSTPLPIGLKVAQSPLYPILISKIVSRSAVETSLKGVYGDPSKLTQEVVDQNYEISQREGNSKALGDSLRTMLAEDHSAEIATLKTPTLIIWGDKDNVVPVSDAERFHRDIAGSELVRFPEAGHMVQEEDPAASVAAFERWLEK